MGSELSEMETSALQQMGIRVVLLPGLTAVASLILAAQERLEELTPSLPPEKQEEVQSIDNGLRLTIDGVRAMHDYFRRELTNARETDRVLDEEAEYYRTQQRSE